MMILITRENHHTLIKIVPRKSGKKLSLEKTRCSMVFMKVGYRSNNKSKYRIFRVVEMKLFKMVADKPDCIIVHAGTDITKGINSLTSVKKIVKKVKQTSPNSKVVFSSLLTRKDKKDLDKKVQDVNNRLKNYCMQTNLDYIENNNIKEEHLGNKKLHLNKKRNTLFANNLLKYLTSCFLKC